MCVLSGSGRVVAVMEFQEFPLHTLHAPSVLPSSLFPSYLPHPSLAHSLIVVMAVLSPAALPCNRDMGRPVVTISIALWVIQVTCYVGASRNSSRQGRRYCVHGKQCVRYFSVSNSPEMLKVHSGSRHYHKLG